MLHRTIFAGPWMQSVAPDSCATPVQLYPSKALNFKVLPSIAPFDGSSCSVNGYQHKAMYTNTPKNRFWFCLSMFESWRGN